MKLKCNSSILIRSFVYRYVDLMKFFPRGRTALSAIFNFIVDYVMTEKGHVLKSFDQQYLARDKIEAMCEAINRKGSPYKHCFAFIDGTVRGICRPSCDQRDVKRKCKEI